jgi:hypothetical protein
MKKLLLIILPIMVLLISGCTVDDYKNNREAFMNDCKADAECIAYVIEDADEIIKQTPTYLEIAAELQAHEDRISSLEELTEPEYLTYLRNKWKSFMNNNGDCGTPQTAVRTEVDGIFDTTITMTESNEYCPYTPEQIDIIIDGLHSELPNYNVVDVIK